MRATVVLILGTGVVLAACTSTSGTRTAESGTRASITAPSREAPSSQASSTPAPTPAPTPPPSASPTPVEPMPGTSADPAVARIGDRQWARIEATGTWRPGCPVGRADLRRLDVNYVDFDGAVQRGRLVAHRDSVDDLAAILSGLFKAGFPIHRMDPVEEYGGDVVRSLEANNTSAFNCRRPDQINAPVLESPHANGRAIDINPYQNPWTDPRCDCWVPSADFATDRRGPGVITEDSLPWQLFTERGWIWQDIKVPDYMHFDTGYPSRPR